MTFQTATGLETPGRTNRIRLIASALAIASRLLRIALPMLSILGFWYLAILLSGLPEFVIPRPEQVLATLIADREMIWQHLLLTLSAALLGFVCANLVGIGLAMILTLLPMLRGLVMPTAVAIRNVPYVALATVLALASGDSMVSKVTIICIAGFFPVLVNTVRGLQSVDQVVLDRMHVLNAGPWRVFWQVRMPYALPFIIAAQEIVGSSSIVVAVAAEWMISSSGLGFVINRAMAQYRGDQVYAVALLAALMSFGIYMFLQFVGRRISWSTYR